MATKKKRVPASKPKASTPKASKATQASPKPKRKLKRKPAGAKRSAVKSVDGLLKSFESEKVTLNTKLGAYRKKIEQTTKKIAVLKTELEKAKRDLVETELAIETIDTRRDKEIGSLLSGLGVDLGKAAAAVKSKPVTDQSTPLFDETPSDSDKLDDDSTSSIAVHVQSTK